MLYFYLAIGMGVEVNKLNKGIIMGNIEELKLIEQLSKENSKLKKAGGYLAQRAIYTITNFDGLHRLSLAVANWATTIANEGERSKNKT